MVIKFYFYFISDTISYYLKFNYRVFEMKIISKSRDFYDSVQGFGTEDFVFIRKTSWAEIDKRFSEDPLFKEVRETWLKSYNNFYYRGRENNRYNITFKSMVVGFCGKIHPLISLTVVDLRNNSERSKIVYSNEDIIKFLELNNYADLLDKFKKSPKSLNSFFGRTTSKFCEITCRNFFSINKYSDKFTKLFFENKSPIFLLSEIDEVSLSKGRHRRIHLTINPNLKELDFQRVVSSFEAYQELSMYIMGVLGVNTPEIIEVADKYKRDAKGFNEWSFKTRPSKKPES
jgi:hypothetical protein